MWAFPFKSTPPYDLFFPHFKNASPFSPIYIYSIFSIYLNLLLFIVIIVINNKIIIKKLVKSRVSGDDENT